MICPPPYFSLPSLKALIEAGRGVLSDDDIASLAHLGERGLPAVVSVHSLSLLSGLSAKFVGAIARNPSRYYRRFEIRKRPGEYRTIYAPKVALKIFQGWFGHHLARAVTTADHVHGFVPGRSTVTAASAHCPARWALSIDIRAFFPSVSKSRVFDVLLHVGYPRKAAHLVADICTLSGALPQGSPASPVLANLAMATVDEKLALLAEEEGIRVTRYADDITFSGTDDVPRGLAERTRSILQADGWQIAEEKTCLVNAPSVPRVLGIVVGGCQPGLPKTYRNRIRMMKHMLERGGLSPIDEQRFRGHVAYARSVG